jgi:dUTP pyrophosphatase
MPTMKIPLVRLDPGLPIPSHAHPGDAGVDLYARCDVRLEPGERRMVPTGVAVAIPDGHVGLVAPRSGLAARLGISAVNAPGVIDAGFRGEIHAILVNLGAETVELGRGERIVQLVVVPVETQDFVEVEQLPDSVRGVGGFGSTGT